MTALATPTLSEPISLPVSHLSVSSLNLYERCPEAWKRRYVLHEYERSTGKMTLGKTAGAALAQHYATQLETGEGLSTEAVLDEYGTDWDARTESEDIDYQDEKPGTLKDAGAKALRIYHAQFAPRIVPVAVEREFLLSWPDVEFTLTGFLDLETAAGTVADFKMGKRIGEDKAASELQPTVYLAARRAEDNPAAGFEYHAMILNKQPTADIVPTGRTDRQLDLLTVRVMSIARSISWRWEHDCWQGTGPDAAWMCRSCSHAETCVWRRG